MKKDSAMITAAISIFCILLLAGCQKSTDAYKAGVYTAFERGYVDNIEVEVEFSNNEILSIEILSQHETSGYGDKAVEQLPAIILDAQSPEVDSISGATISSDAIKKAVGDCIEQAKQ